MEISTQEMKEFSANQNPKDSKRKILKKKNRPRFINEKKIETIQHEPSDPMKVNSAQTSQMKKETKKVNQGTKRKAETEEPKVEAMDIEDGMNKPSEEEWTTVVNVKKLKMKEKKKEKKKQNKSKTAFVNPLDQPTATGELSEEALKLLEELKLKLNSYEEIRQNLQTLLNQSSPNTVHDTNITTNIISSELAAKQESKQTCITEIGNFLGYAFHERNRPLLYSLIEIMSSDELFQIVKQTLEIQAKGGMTVNDPNLKGRKRSIGGVFFFLSRNYVPKESKKIFSQKKVKKGKDMNE